MASALDEGANSRDEGANARDEGANARDEGVRVGDDERAGAIRADDEDDSATPDAAIMVGSHPDATAITVTNVAGKPRLETI